MKRILFDVNVLLDFLLDRAPFAEHTAALWGAAERKEIQAFVPAHAVTTVFHLAARHRDAAFARRVVSDLLVVPTVAAVDESILRRALALGWSDFEDAVCGAAAEALECDLLVTRDLKAFRDSPVLAVDPQTALSLISGRPGPGEVAERPLSPAGVRPRGWPGRRATRGGRRRPPPRRAG